MDDLDVEGTLATVQGWTDGLGEVDQRLRPYFARREAHQRALAYLRGLLSPIDRKNSWQLAEIMGDATPYGFQHLLGRADWDADSVRDELRQYIHDYLHDDAAIVVIDETGFLKKGRQSAGVARQYSGTAGRIENCQIGVFLAYVSVRGHTLLDRELYLPNDWIADRDRCQRAAIPETRTFATKPQLARQMLARVFASDVSVAWVTGDSIYGDNRPLRTWLEAEGQAYVLAVSGKEYVWQADQQQRMTTLLATLPETGWTRLSAGDGAKGPRWYDWLRLPTADPAQPGWCRWVLVRRQISDPTDLAAYVVFAPAATTLEELVRVAGSRWAIEVCFEAAKSTVGLDQYEVRSWTGWYRHITLVLWAQALLTAIQTEANLPAAAKKGGIERPLTSSLTAFKARRGL
jgi:SRSO17 transposase